MNLQARLRSKIGGRSGFKEEDIISLHDVFMIEYGWIPIKEFAKLPIPTMFELADQIKRRKEAEKRQMDSARRK